MIQFALTCVTLSLTRCRCKLPAEQFSNQTSILSDITPHLYTFPPQEEWTGWRSWSGRAAARPAQAEDPSLHGPGPQGGV